jgi:hypothetical protein
MSSEMLLKGCQWIGSGTWATRCGADCVPHKSYCIDHVWMVYHKDTEQYARRKPKNTSTSVEFWEDLFEQAVRELEAEQLE